MEQTLINGVQAAAETYVGDTAQLKEAYPKKAINIYA